MTPAAFLLQNPNLGRRHFHPHARGKLPCHLRTPPSPKLTYPSGPISLPAFRGRAGGFLPFPSAALSSFAESEGGEEGQNVEEKGGQPPPSGELPAVARAFHISSRTAFAIIACIAFAALTFPLLMQPMVQASGVKQKALSYVTLLLGFYMAWNIGANDVANAMGTSVGSGALTLRQAVLTAAVLEFSGALLMGTHVTSTMQKGILVGSVFQGNSSLLFAGLLSSLAAAGTWLQVCASVSQFASALLIACVILS